MNYKLQLISFLASFLFGIFFSFANEIHYKLITRQKVWMKYILTIIFIIIIVLLYIILIYFINHGIFHVYFLLFLLLGYCVTLGSVKKIICSVKSKIKQLQNRKK